MNKATSGCLVFILTVCVLIILPKPVSKKEAAEAEAVRIAAAQAQEEFQARQRAWNSLIECLQDNPGARVRVRVEMTTIDLGVECQKSLEVLKDNKTILWVTRDGTFVHRVVNEPVLAEK